MFAVVIAAGASAQPSRTRRAPDRQRPPSAAERRAERDAKREAGKKAEAAAAAKFKPGQLVEAMWIREWLPAQVVSVEGEWVRVRFDEDGFEKDARPEDVRPRGAAEQPPAARADAPAGNTPGGPDATVPSVKGPLAATRGMSLPPAIEPDWSAARQLTPDATAAWSFKPPAAKRVPITPKNVMLPPAYPPERNDATKSRSIFEKLTGVTRPDPFGPFLYLKYRNTDPRVPKQIHVHKVDAAAGRLVATLLFPDETNLIDATADGRLALLRSEKFGSNGRGRLDVYDISGAEPKHVVGFEPFKDAGLNKTDVVHARLMDDTHVFASNGERAALLQTQGAKAVWTIQLERATQTAVSHDRSTLALSTPEAIYLLDAKTGNWTGRIPTETQVFGLSFSPDQTRLSGESDDHKLQIWDLSTAKQTHDLPLQFGVHGGFADWLDDGQLFLANQDLFDLAKGAVVWQYTRNAFEPPLFHFGNRFGMVDEETKGPDRRAVATRQVSFFTLPHPAAKQRAAALQVKDVLLVQPGAKVSLDVQFDGPPEARQKAEARARAELVQNGVTIADGQLVRLLISSAPGETKEIGYGRTDFRTGRREVEDTVSVTEQIHRVALLVGEKTVLWEATGRFTGQGLFRKEESKSMAEVLEESKLNSYRFFENIEIPKLIPKPKALIPPGWSPLTPQGPKGDTIPEPVKIEPAATAPKSEPSPPF